MTDFLASAYLWILSLHVISFVAWMAGLFYLPRLFVYHVERANGDARTEALFETMENKLLRVIMNPAMILTWIFGLLLVWTPGIVDWTQPWPWIKTAGVIALSAFHMWCSKQRRLLAAGQGTRPGSFYRKMNEAPTVLLIIIVIAVIVKPF